MSDKIQFDLIALGGGILILAYGLFADQSWIIYGSRASPIILGAGLILIVLLDIIFR
jgi:hypothetical protein